MEECVMLVGITGFAGSGKDTAALALLDIGWERRAFADPLRTGLLGCDPWINTSTGDYGFVRLSEIIAEIGWDEAKRKFPEVRRLAQAYGTEGGRDIHGQQCWIEAAERTLDGSKDYVFTDVRFPNERDFIHAHDGIVIRICRDGIGAVNAHVSEQVLDNIDAGIFNNGSIEELHHEVVIVALQHWNKRNQRHQSEIDIMLREQQRPIQFGGVQLPRIP
jgi:hypothetical protein